jgi:hypothetical protein
MSCKICGTETIGWFCMEHNRMWAGSPEMLRRDSLPTAFGPEGRERFERRARVAVFDFITRIRLERLNGGQS